MSELIVERSGDVLKLSLDRPQRANSLGPDLVEELIQVFEDLRGARLVVLTGEGKSFCSGFDLSDIDSLSDGDLLWRFVRIEHLLQLVNHAPAIVLALAHRYAIGAGADLLGAATMRVAAPATMMRMPGLNFEITLGTRRLARMVGDATARDILIDTRFVAAEEAHALGLLTRIADVDEWPSIIDEATERAMSLSPLALANMLDATRKDTRAEDMAALVASAGRPGLCDRVSAYIESVNAAKNAS